MLTNYFITARRSLLKSKGYSLIKIGGLGVGMAVAMLIGLWIYDELSFNKYHQNYDRIAYILRHYTSEGKKETGGQSNPIALGTALATTYKDDFTHVVLSTRALDYILSSGNKKFREIGRFMQPQAPELLTLRMLKGSRAGLKEVNSILLSETLAKKLFGDADPVDKVVAIDTKINAKVTGVYEDIPKNSEFHEVVYIAPFDLYLTFNQWAVDARDNWGDNSFPIYAQIAPHTTFERVSAKIKDVMMPHLNPEKAAMKPEVFLHPMAKWHLYSKFENGVNVKSDALTFLWFYSIIGMFVLLLACINFMNLSTARSEKRAKEVGIRKAIGSVQYQLIMQFLIESVLVAGLAFTLCLALVWLLLPWFNGIADKKIALPWLNAGFWLTCVAFTLVTAMLAGSYPAFYLSSLQPIKVLKGTYRGGKSAAAFRKVLVVFQFTISIALIIGTITVYRQIQLAKNRPVGYDRRGLITFSKDGIGEKAEVLRNELLRTGVVYEAGESASRLTNVGSNNAGFEWKGKTPGADDDFGTIRVSYDYGKTVGWQFVAGRDFSRNFVSDSSGIVVNEAAVRLMGLQNPVGEIVRSEYWQKGDYKILGVVKDMVMESPFEPTRPTIFSLQGYKRFIFLKIDPRVSVHEALPKIEAVFRAIAPAAPFEYKFVDEEYAAKFAAEDRVGNLAGFFSVLAILISCVGLFGLAYFVAEKRTKEISIRKVMGASVYSIWNLLSKEFVVLTVVSWVIALPIAYHFLQDWLQNYQYRAPISWIVLAGVGIGAVLITLLTVSFQAIRAAMAKPTKALTE